MYYKYRVGSFIFKGILPGVIVLMTLFAYSDVRNHQFLNLDDNAYITENGHVQKGLNIKSIRWAFSFNGVSYWHPLSWISHILDCQLFGLSPGAHHMVNVAIHILNALILYLIIFKMTGARYGAVLVALLFAVHPLNVESVAWVTERKTTLSTFFFLTALYAYAHYTEKKTMWIYGLVLCTYALGLLSKPSIIPFPFLLLILDFWPLKRFAAGNMADGVTANSRSRLIIRLSAFQWSGAALLLLEKIPFFILSFLSIYLSMLSMSKFGIVVTHDLVPMDLRIQNLFVSITKYLGLLAWPFGLSIFYPFPKSIPVWKSLLSLSFVFLMTVATLMLRKSRPWLVAGWFWFLIALAPASGLVQAGLWPEIANRFMYIPMIGLFIMLVWECDAWIGGRYSNALKIIPCCVLLVYFVYGTKLQNLYFSNSYALFTRSIAVTGGNVIAYNGIGTALQSLNRVDEAMVYFEKALAITPAYDESLNNYGVCLLRKGDYLHAKSYFFRAIAASPEWPVAYLNLALNQHRMGMSGEAIRLLEKALELEPGNSHAHNNFGFILSAQGKTEEAIRHFRSAVETQPNLIEARSNLSQAYEKARRYEEALAEYEALIKLKPEVKGVTYYFMAGVKSKQNRLEECKGYLDLSLKHGFDALTQMKADERFNNFRETAIYTQFLENKGGGRH